MKKFFQNIFENILVILIGIFFIVYMMWGKIFINGKVRAATDTNVKIVNIV